jgi:aminopeptidase N
MKEGQPREIRLDDYQAPGYTTESTNLVFDIQDGETRVTNTMQVARCEDGAQSLYLDGQDLDLLSVRVDGRELSGNEYKLDDESLTIHGLGERHEIRIETRIYPEKNTALEGLYRSSSMYCTQCEAEGFRKITYYQDRPDVLARFTTTIIADAARYPILLSNGNRIDEQDVGGFRRSVTWEDPFPKPSYLFALVAGDLECIEDNFVTMHGREVVLQIYSEPHNIEHCHYAMDVLKRSMAWDEQRFGREYDLDIFMIVAVEDFNMGAMENKGLNIFNTSCVLASPDTATDAAYQRVEAVVAHEYFHNWSGNRVTCRDWFQLSLKEGFTVFRDAEFTSDMNSRAVKRIEDVTFLRAVQFAEDAGPLAHPVRPQSYIEISNFYTTTIYEKGAEVVRMYHTLLGEEKFRAGSDLYFERHDGSAATTDDFAAVMAEVSGEDLSQFKLWYEQAGTPVLKVTERYDDGELTLVIEQECPATPQQDTKEPFHIPLAMGLLDEDGDPVSLYDLVIDTAGRYETRDRGNTLLVALRDRETHISFSYLESKPVVSLLRGFSAPVKVEYPRNDSELAFLAQHDIDGFVKWDALQTLWTSHFADDGASHQSLLLQLVGEIAGEALDLEGDTERKLLAATMLAVPDENYLFEQLESFQLDDLLDRRDRLLDELGEAHLQLWIDLYENYRSDAPYQPDAAGMANRALSNLGFAYAARTMSGSGLAEFIDQHYQAADNLTDRRTALNVVCRHPALDETVRQQLLQDFYDKWRHQALVMDMWFSLQAQSPLTDVDALSRLEQHELFDLKNPNRARSLFSAFGMYNHRRFHALDGSGYAFLAGAIGRIDALNPQLASRTTTPLTRWKRYDDKRQALMREQLQQLAGAETISKDLYEIVTKSLG